jgi:hypothetical protein
MPLCSASSVYACSSRVLYSSLLRCVIGVVNKILRKSQGSKSVDNSAIGVK